MCAHRSFRGLRLLDRWGKWFSNLPLAGASNDTRWSTLSRSNFACRSDAQRPRLYTPLSALRFRSPNTSHRRSTRCDFGLRGDSPVSDLAQTDCWLRITQAHAAYCEHLRAFYDQHKAAYNMADRPLVFVGETNLAFLRALLLTVPCSVRACRQRGLPGEAATGGQALRGR
jgi:hypothetical protein